MHCIIIGLPGSGKTFLSEKLAKTFNAETIHSDKVRKEIALDKEYTEEAKWKVYNEMIDRAANSDSSHVFVDATFSKEKYRHLAESKLKKDKTFFIETIADERIIFNRINKSRKYSDADFEIYKKLKEDFEPMREAHLVVSSQQEVDVMIRQIKHYLTLDEE